MKRIIAILAIVALLAACALAEGGFALREGVAWGMTRQQVLDAEGNPQAEADHEAGFDILEIEDAALYDSVCDLEYFFRNDALVACACDFDAGGGQADFARLNEALTGQYGAALEPDTERWHLLEDILDGEMESRSIGSYACWQPEDGTFVALVEDAGDGDVGLYFYNETAIIETAL